MRNRIRVSVFSGDGTRRVDAKGKGQTGTPGVEDEERAVGGTQKAVRDKISVEIESRDRAIRVDTHGKCAVDTRGHIEGREGRSRSIPDDHQSQAGNRHTQN